VVDNQQNRQINGLLIIIGAVATTILILYFVHFHDGFDGVQATWGAFGDLLGGTLGPLLSFTAVIVALKTLELQRLDIKDQDIENKRIQRKQEDDSNTQRKLFERSEFESSFFNLLKIHNDSVAMIEISTNIIHNDVFPAQHETVYSRGLICFKIIYDTWSSNYYGASLDVAHDHHSVIQSKYETIYSEFGHIIGQYFRRLFNIIEYIDKHQGSFWGETEVEIKRNKKKYMKLLRSQLSVYELKLLFYNTLTTYGNEFRNFIEHYELLKGVITRENDDTGFSNDLIWANTNNFLNNTSWGMEPNT